MVGKSLEILVREIDPTFPETITADAFIRQLFGITDVPVPRVISPQHAMFSDYKAAAARLESLLGDYSSSRLIFLLGMVHTGVGWEKTTHILTELFAKKQSLIGQGQELAFTFWNIFRRGEYKELYEHKIQEKWLNSYERFGLISPHTLTENLAAVDKGIDLFDVQVPPEANSFVLSNQVLAVSGYEQSSSALAFYFGRSSIWRDSFSEERMQGITYHRFHEIRSVLSMLERMGVLRREKVLEMLKHTARSVVDVVTIRPQSDSVAHFRYKSIELFAILNHNLQRNLFRSTDSEKENDAPVDPEWDGPASAYLEGGIDVQEILAELWIVASEILEAVGWINPDTLYEHIGTFLRSAYAVNFGEKRVRPGDKVTSMRKLLDNLFSHSVAGNAIAATSQILNMASAIHEFQRQAESNGYPLTAVTEGDDILLQNAFPEHVLLDIYSRRFEAYRTITEGVDYWRSKHVPRDPSGRNFHSLVNNFHTALRILHKDEAARKEVILEKLNELGLASVLQLSEQELSDESVVALIDQVIDRIKTATAGTSFLRPYSQEEVRQISALWNFIEWFNDYPRQAKVGQFDRFYGDRLEKTRESWNRLVELNEIAIIGQDFTLEAGEPVVLLGSNGAGKSTMIATVLQKMLAGEWVIASKSQVPKAEPVTAVRDVIEAGATALQQARQAGRSNFMTELRELTAVIEAFINGKSTLFADEIGKRTDELNGMAINATIVLLTHFLRRKTALISHYNRLPELLNPLLEELGVQRVWGTMENYQFRQCKEFETAKSNALHAATPFISTELAAFWCQELQIVEVLELGKERRQYSYQEIHLERLKQMGWITYERNEVKLSGSVEGVYGRTSRPARPAAFQYDIRSVPILIETVLNPRWGFAPKIGAWMADMKEPSNYEKIDKKVSVFIRAAQLARAFSMENERNRQEQYEKYQAQFVQLKSDFLLLGEEWQKELSQVFGEFVDSTETQVAAVVMNSSTIYDLMKKIPDEAYEKAVIFDAVLAAVVNTQSSGLVDSIPTSSSTIELQNFWSVSLQENISRRRRLDPNVPDVVRNSIELASPINILSGPQGSGKTESGVAIAEIVFNASIGLPISADFASFSEEWEVLPLFATPNIQETATSSKRQFSSWEKEARYRMEMIAQFCYGLPAGKKPLICIDEFGVSTSSVDAAYAIRAITGLVESCGGKVLLATHNHELIWQLEKLGKPHGCWYVTPFWSDDPYRLVPGHGESLGLEAANRLGFDSRFVELATVVRDYLVVAGGNQADLVDLKRTAQLVQKKIQQFETY